jgi:murein hydrolase activator
LIFLGFLGWVHPGMAETDLQKIHSGMVESKKELGGIKKKIQEEKRRIKEFDKKESSAISQLNVLDQNLFKKEKERRILDQKLKTVVQKVGRATEDLSFLNQNISSQETLVANRLVALYKFQDMGLPEVLFSSRSYEEFRTQQRYFSSILLQDRELIEDYRKRQASIQGYRDQLRDDERELQRFKKKTERKKAEIQKNLGQKKKLLHAVREEKRVHLTAVKDLEAASIRLQALVDRLEREIRAKEKERTFSSAGKGLGALRGKLPFPVKGRILSTFGKNENPKFNTFTLQKGIEIEAAIGAEVRSVHEGRVLYSDWFKGYGKILIIDHGEGYYTLSGHVSSLLKQIGEEVRRGDVVALAGDTGSLRGPCLYFEIRHRGKPLDPLEWLAQPGGR